MSFTEEDIVGCTLEENPTVIVTVTNSGYLLYTLNMLKSLEPYGLDKKVWIVCMDALAAKVLRERGYQAWSENQEDLARFCPWNTKGYDEICYTKLRVIHRLLTLKRNVLLVDGDIVFRKTPMEDWKRWWSSSQDVYVQNDSDKNEDTTNLCTGYMWIRETPLTLQAYDCVSQEGRERYNQCAFDNNDQTYFNRFVKPNCRVCPLPLEDYPNGNVYRKRERELRDRCVLVHFNWLKGHHKLVAMKEHRMWLLIPEEEETPRRI